MRLLITGPALRDPGGVSAYFDAVLPQLRSQVAEVHYLEIGGTLARGGFLSPMIDQWRFRSTLRRLQPDLVHCNPSLDFKCFLRDGLFVRQAAGLGYPVLVFFHGWKPEFDAVVQRYWLGVFRRTFGRARAFIVLASQVRSRLAEWGVTAPVHLGMTAVSQSLLDGVKPADAAPRPSNEPLRILFLARLERSKGIRETLAAFALLRERKVAATLTVAGDGAARDDVQAFIAAHPQLSPVIQAVGDVRGGRKRELFMQHDLYCFPSYTEGMPTSVLEAMYFGLPVVTSAVGGLVDFFEDGRMGRMLRDIDAASIADAIAGLAASPDAMRAMGARNREFASTHFTAAAAADRLTAVYSQVLGRPA